MSKKKTENALFMLEDAIDILADHGFQKGDILALINVHIDVHRPDCIEEYLDGTNPRFFYGPEEK